MRFAFYNPSEEPRSKWLVLDQPGIEYFRLYQLFQGSIDSCEGGLGRDRQKSCSASYLNSIRLDIAPGDTLICYLFLYERVHYFKTKNLRLFDENPFFEYHVELDRQLDKERIFLSITCSLIFFIACFFAFQSLFGWNTSYLWYALYLTALTLFFLRHLEALSNEPILFGHFQWVLIATEMPWIGFVTATYIKFVLDFFQFGDRYPTHFRLFTFYMWISIIEITIGILLDVFFFERNYSKPFFANSQLVGAIFQIYAITVLLKKPGLPYRLVVIGTIFLTMTSGFTILVPYDMRRTMFGVPLLLFQIGAIVEVLFFSAAFGIRMSQIEKSRRTYERIRENISSDLHDEIGSTLSSIAILSEALQRKTATGDNHQSIGVITERTRQVMDTMSDIVWSINPLNDEMDAVLLKMREFAVETLEAKEILLHFHTDDVLPTLRLVIEQRKDFYLFFKEAINNAAKYAQATEVWVSITKVGKDIQMKIQDNGQGFNPELIRRGNGLQNMQERTHRLHGNWTLESTPGQGTQIYLSFPIT